MANLMIDFFDETARKNADKTAIIDGNEKITFSKLKEISLNLSNIIISKINGEVRQPIAVYTKKSIANVASDIGILYSGNAFLNLDVKSPANRINAILVAIKPKLIISTKEYAKNLESIYPRENILIFDDIEFNAVTIDQTLKQNQLSKIIDIDPMCIITTSGSTGTPKGVVLNHRSFIDFTKWAYEAGLINDIDIIGNLSPIVFDLYCSDLCMMMRYGTSIVLLSEKHAAFPTYLLETVRDNKVSYIFWVPTIMVNIANMNLLDKIALPDLKTIWFSGEVFPTKQFNVWRKHLPHAKLVNLYGPVEATVDVTYYVVEKDISDEDPIPIGYACENTDVFLLSEENTLCKAGEEGEICIRGTSLAMGYYNDPEKTSKVFVQNPLNKQYPEIIYKTGDIGVINEAGEMIFRGRKDTLIKHAGYRIELGEIEHTIINKLKLIENGCIVYNPVAKEIVLYYETKSGITPQEIRIRLTKELPQYMIPSKYIKLNAMPRNTNGKIDRLYLKELCLKGE